MTTATDTVTDHLKKTRESLVRNRDVLDRSIRDLDSLMAQYVPGGAVDVTTSGSNGTSSASSSSNGSNVAQAVASSRTA